MHGTVNLKFIEQVVKGPCWSCSYNMATHEKVRVEIVMSMFEKNSCLAGSEPV
jgi:hypothetical protein